VTDAGRRAALDAIASEIVRCTRCRLHEGRNRAVPGEGHPDTEVVFVGEGPGFNEDQQGRPFVGRAGDLLEKLLASICWKREEVFIANVVKCRPPENRDPAADEIEACAAYLTRQIEVLDPALIVTLGRFSMARFNPGAKISQVHGTYRAAHADAGAPNALAFFMYHPAAALRAPSVERLSYSDIRGVPQALLEARARRGSAANEPTAGPEPQARVEAPTGAAQTAQSVSAVAQAADALSQPVPAQIALAAESDPSSQLTLF
jgi:DNA polymerase